MSTEKTRQINGPVAAYQALIEEGELKPDPDQAYAVAQLEQLYQALISYPEIKVKHSNHPITNWLKNKLDSFFDRQDTTPKGFYLYGGVGRGKSMLMDLFFSVAPHQSKRRIHFHEFMLDVHARLNTWHTREAKERNTRGSSSKARDPIPVIAGQIANEATLLCFDELQISDIADAMVITRLFEVLFAYGVIVVTTSNRLPDDLYKNGLNRQVILPFIAQLKEKLEILSLNGPTDYRYDRLRGVQTYYYPINEATTAKLAEAFFRLTDRDIADRAKVPSGELIVQGRKLFVPKAARGVAVFSYKRLCANPLGSADYLAIARAFHTVIMVAIPQLGKEKSNEAKRFVTFIDALYEHGVKFLCSAAVPPQSLYPAGEGAFEFERTVSRLMEMQSERYLSRGHGLNTVV